MNNLKYMYVKIKIYIGKKKKRKKITKREQRYKAIQSVCLDVEQEYEKRDEEMGGINDNFIS